MNFVSRKQVSLVLIVALLIGYVLHPSPAQAASPVASASAQSVYINLLNSTAVISASDPATRATNDGTQATVTQSNAPANALLAGQNFLSVGALAELAVANPDGTSYACSGIVKSGGSLQVGANSLCTVANSPSGGVTLDLGQLISVNGNNPLAAVANVQVSFNSISASATQNSAGVTTRNATLTGGNVRVCLLGCIVPINVPLNLSGDPNQDLLTAVVNSLTGNFLLSGVVSILSNTVSGVVSIKTNYQPATVPGTPATVSALHIELLGTVGASADLAKVSVGPNTPPPAPVHPPTLTNINPNTAFAGDSLVLTGTNFINATQVRFGSTAALYTVVNSTTINATVPAGTGTVDITVTNPDGTSTTSAASKFTYATVPVDTPNIASLTPTEGYVGDTVQITGTDLSCATQVLFDGVEASFTINNSTSITTTAPGHLPGQVKVQVVCANGSSDLLDPEATFTYLTPSTPIVPDVTALLPSSGLAGTSVTIEGINLACATAVIVDGVSVTFTKNADNTLTFLAPAHNPGTVPVVVVCDDGSSSSFDPQAQFTYNTPPQPVIPEVEGLSPTSGTPGTPVVITGTDLACATDVKVDGVSVAFVLNSDGTITFTAPAHAPGTVSVVVICADGPSSSNDPDAQFTYLTIPTVTSITPASGLVGTEITVIGENLACANAVTVGGIAATFVKNPNGTLTVTAPTNAPGTFTLVVTCDDGSSSNPNPNAQFTYNTPPQPIIPDVTSLSPTNGVEGTVVVIGGVNLSCATQVLFNNVSTYFTKNANGTITAIAPTNSPATVPVVIVCADGSSSAADPQAQFTYNTPPVVVKPTVSDVLPGSAPVGATVTIVGTNLNCATQVLFGTTPASFTVVDAQTISAVAPNHALGLVHVQVICPDGSSDNTTSASEFTFEAPVVVNPPVIPNITNVYPNQGSPGTTITITGTNLNCATQVLFGNVPASKFLVNANGSITAVAPNHNPGATNVTVVCPDGSSAPSANSVFTYVASQGGAAGYWQVAYDGGIFAFGAAPFYGSTGSLKLNSPIVGMASTPDGRGYWLVASDGGIFAFGNAKFFGSMGATKLNKPIVGIATTPTGNGYWMVASDGGIFSFGDAKFYGSTGAIKLNQPIVAITPTASGNGYWLVASDGGIFAFGDAKFYGSMGGSPLNKPIVALAATKDGQGYWMVASDGGVFAFGNAPFYGSTGSIKLNKPIVGMAPTPDGKGYWMSASDGGIFAFGSAPFYGSMGGRPLNQPMNGMSAFIG